MKTVYVIDACALINAAQNYAFLDEHCRRMRRLLLQRI